MAHTTASAAAGSNETIHYYNSHVADFTDSTQKIANFAAVQDRFLERLTPGASILDFGCGTGRDSKYFLEKGYNVEAIDGSEELCKVAAEFTGLDVRHVYFQDFDETEKYDAVWACASLLHLATEELPAVLRKIHHALKPDGLFYASFKYGDFEGFRNGRHFTDMTEQTAKALVERDGLFEVLDVWISGDLRPDKSGRVWLNIVSRVSK